MDKDNEIQEELEETQDESQDNEGDSDEQPKERQDDKYDEQLRALQERIKREQEEKENYKKALQAEREKEKTPEKDMDVDKIVDTVSQQVDQKVNQLKVDMTAATFDEELDKLTDNPKEKQLIKAHYGSSIKPSGIDRKAIRRDLKLAKAAANIDNIDFKQTADDAEAGMATAMSGSSTGKVSNAQATRSKNIDSVNEEFLQKYGVDPNELE